MHAVQVFTPDSLPNLTYVNRSDMNYEDELRTVSRADKVLVSLFGPSKSGKTVLLERVIGESNLIKVSGATIKEAEDVWRTVLAKLEAPVSTQVGSTQTNKTDAQAKLGFDGSVPLLAKAKTEASIGRSHQSSTERRETREPNIFAEVERLLARTHRFVLIDDFHYIASAEVQTRLAHQIKDMFECGVKIAVAQVLHRKDDVLRSNPELRGRLRAFSFSYWKHEDLVKIGRQGFPYLRIDIQSYVLDQFAREAAGSPQLMQQICLQTCIELKILEDRNAIRSVVPMTDAQIERVFRRAARTADYESLCNALADGPKERGRARNVYTRTSAPTKGDTYELILDAIAMDPPLLRFDVDELRARMKLLCKDDFPKSGQVISSCAQIQEIVEERFSAAPAIEWDSEKEVLDITDPYLLFYLRWGRPKPQVA